MLIVLLNLVRKTPEVIFKFDLVILCEILSSKKRGF